MHTRHPSLSVIHSDKIASTAAQQSQKNTDNPLTRRAIRVIPPAGGTPCGPAGRRDPMETL